MRQVRLVDGRGRSILAEVPTTRRERLRGLLGRRDLPEGRALLLERTRSVHTFGMRFPIAVALLDRRLQVLQVRRVAPWRLVLPRPGTRHLLECAVDVGLLPGDVLRTTDPAQPTADARSSRGPPPSQRDAGEAPTWPRTAD